MPDGERLTAYFSGYVQGVGFRFTALNVARGYPRVSGYVRNMADGRVELVAEGSSDDIEALVQEVGRAMQSYVRSVDTVRGEATGQFRGFTVKY